MQPSDPDVGLMLAFREGDHSALATLYGRWAPRLLHYLERIVKEPAVAEELLQDTFIRVFDARERYVPEARFSTWLFHIARNLACNELARSRSRHPHVSTDGDGVGLPGGGGFGGGSGSGSGDGEGDGRGRGGRRLVLVAGGPAPDDHADARREHERFERALATLPERQQTALWLAVVEGQSYEEIAGVLGSSVQSVKNLVHRARAGLADQGIQAANGAAERRR